MGNLMENWYKMLLYFSIVSSFFPVFQAEMIGNPLHLVELSALFVSHSL
jgi:vacuolar-type H+-ATPase subunit I/STV1